MLTVASSQMVLWGYKDGCFKLGSIKDLTTLFTLFIFLVSPWELLNRFVELLNSFPFHQGC